MTIFKPGDIVIYETKYDHRNGSIGVVIESTGEFGGGPDSACHVSWTSGELVKDGEKYRYGNYKGYVNNYPVWSRNIKLHEIFREYDPTQMGDCDDDI